MYAVEEYTQVKHVMASLAQRSGGRPLQLTSGRQRRSRLTSPRRFFASSRRCRLAFVGLVAVRGRRTSSAWASRSARRSSASSRLRSCERVSCADAVTRGPSRAVMRAFCASVSALGGRRRRTRPRRARRSRWRADRPGRRTGWCAARSPRAGWPRRGGSGSSSGTSVNDITSGALATARLPATMPVRVCGRCPDASEERLSSGSVSAARTVRTEPAARSASRCCGCAPTSSSSRSSAPAPTRRSACCTTATASGSSPTCARCSRGHSRQDAEDVLQDVFVRAFGALRSDARDDQRPRVALPRRAQPLHRPPAPAAPGRERDLRDVAQAAARPGRRGPAPRRPQAARRRRRPAARAAALRPADARDRRPELRRPRRRRSTSPCPPSSRCWSARASASSRRRSRATPTAREIRRDLLGLLRPRRQGLGPRAAPHARVRRLPRVPRRAQGRPALVRRARAPAGPARAARQAAGLGGAGGGAAATAGGGGGALLAGGAATATACKVAAVVCATAITAGGAVEVRKLTRDDGARARQARRARQAARRGEGRAGRGGGGRRDVRPRAPARVHARPHAAATAAAPAATASASSGPPTSRSSRSRPPTPIRSTSRCRRSTSTPRSSWATRPSPAPAARPRRPWTRRRRSRATRPTSRSSASCPRSPSTRRRTARRRRRPRRSSSRRPTGTTPLPPAALAARERRHRLGGRCEGRARLSSTQRSSRAARRVRR